MPDEEIQALINKVHAAVAHMDRLSKLAHTLSEKARQVLGRAEPNTGMHDPPPQGRGRDDAWILRREK